MSQEQRYKRTNDGMRFQFGGIDTVHPSDALPTGKFPYAQNVRAYLQGRTTGRATQAAPYATLGAAVHSLRRLNDTTLAGPASGFAVIGGAGAGLYVNATQVASGFSGNSMSFIPFRPNTSPEPWMYVGDSSLAVTIGTFGTNGMVKVRADGLTYKMGVKEPQAAPGVTATNVVVNGNLMVPATTRPWTPTGNQNPAYPFTSTGSSAPVVIACLPGSTVQVNAAGTIVTSYSAAAASGDVGPATSGYAGFNITGAVNVLIGAFTDSLGNVVTPTTGTGPVNVGAGPTTLLVPVGATQLQLGIDDQNYSGNSGAFTVAYTTTTQAVASQVSLIGNVTAYFWGDSPTAGGVGAYQWKNPADSGAGISRTISTAAGSVTNNSLVFDSPTTGTANAPMMWTTLDSTGAITGSKPVFSVPITGGTGNFANFNMCVVATLFIPAAGTYVFEVVSKDNVIWGIGGAATWNGKGSLRGIYGQTMTVVNKCALLPSPAINGGGSSTSTTVSVTFPAAGDYPLELDYDYWYRDGRTLVLYCLSSGVIGTTAYILPLAATVLQNTAYRYTFRSSTTGATSNPSPASIANTNPVQVSTITPTWSNDPQVNKVDFYRMDQALDAFTYVGTGPNTNPPTAFVDELFDADVTSNPLLQYDNYEPFPSIDLPRGGVVNVSGGVATWVSGDQFNLRWLGGTIINVGGIAYTLYNRPSSVTTLLPVDAKDGLGLIYEIDEPILAAQPVVSMWGNTDNAAYVFAIDPLNPGDLVFCKGNNLDSAPDTNRINVTSPSEPLINGVMANGLGMVVSSGNGWSIYPNFSGALATITGTSGTAFTLIRAGVTRGLYIRSAICTDGSGQYFFRSRDGIEVSSSGSKQQSVTDTDLYNLFPHEGYLPQPITIGGYTIYPPNDLLPELQHLAFATGYLYYDYEDITGVRRTLVYDVAASGWVVDTYQWPVTLHMLEEGPHVNGVLTGCSDGSIRALVNNGVEVATCVVLTPAMNSGDARALKTVGDIYVRAGIFGSPVSIQPYFGQYGTQVASYTPATLGANNILSPYLIDFPDGLARIVPDVSVAFSWAAGTATYLDLWQPDWTDLPENTQDRPTDWTDGGASGTMFWQGLTLEADTMGKAKALMIQSGDDLSFHVPDQSPVTFNGQSKQALTFTPPFLAHTVRIVTTDGVPWRYWGASWTALPFPSSVVEWQTEMTSMGMDGWMHLREMNIAYLSNTPLTLTLVFDPGAYPQQILLTVPSSGGLQAKLKLTVPANKFKMVSYRLSSPGPFRVFVKDMECKIGRWGRTESYRNVKPIGDNSAPGATV